MTKLRRRKLQTTDDMKTTKVKQHTSNAPFIVPSAKTKEKIIVKPTKTKNIIPFEINEMKVNNKLFKFSSNTFECNRNLLLLNRNLNKSSCKTAASS